MGAWFSSPRQMLLDWMAQCMIPRVLPPFDLPPFDPRRPCTQEEFNNVHICQLALYALGHYNSKHPDAKFCFPDQPKVACTGFREDIWYHLNFSARRKEDGDEQRFFAELSFIQCPRRLIVKSCTILKKPLCRFKSSCALCPDESKILHPSHVQLGCGKKEHEEELYRERHRRDWDPRRNDYFRREMLETPFQFGRCPNFGVEKKAMKRNSTVRAVK